MNVKAIILDVGEAQHIFQFDADVMTGLEAARYAEHGFPKKFSELTRYASIFPDWREQEDSHHQHSGVCANVSKQVGDHAPTYECGHYLLFDAVNHDLGWLS